MPYKRKDSPVWWVFYIGGDGKRIRCSTGTADRKEAEALEAKWKLEAYRLTHWQEQPPCGFDELMVNYLKGVSVEKRPWGHRRDLDATRHLKGHFRGMDLNHITAVTVRTYIEKRKGEGVCASTINRELSVFSSAVNTAKREWGWNIPNPVSRRKLKEPEGRVRWLSVDEASALIEAARREPLAVHLPDFIGLALHTGCRKGELLNL